MWFLANDYLRMVEVVERVFGDRRIVMKKLNKILKDMKDTEKIDKAQVTFDKLSQTMRRELEHFDNVMKEEFSETFSAYHSQYQTSINNTSTSNNTSPTAPST